jgi:hypothetical protein
MRYDDDTECMCQTLRVWWKGKMNLCCFVILRFLCRFRSESFSQQKLFRRRLERDYARPSNRTNQQKNKALFKHDTHPIVHRPVSVCGGCHRRRRRRRRGGGTMVGGGG